MSYPDENIDPHSFPKLSRLLPNSTHKLNKHMAHKAPSSASGLRESILPNISAEHMHSPSDHVDMQLPTPPTSQSMENVIDGPRLPISPPPEEEIRSKELSAHAHTPKQKDQSRLPVPSRGAPSAPFKFPAAPQSFAQFQQQGHQIPDERPCPPSLTTNAPPSSTNPRKRPRSATPLFVIPTSASSSKVRPELTVTTTFAQSPNPKPRKQPKVHDSGLYTGSGFKRRHTRGTSAESLNAGDDAFGESTPRGVSQKSPARKKHTKDLGVEDYTPQRDGSSKHQGSSTKQKRRAGRSTTPDVPYEPPSEQFTPPRHVVLQQPSSTASTRSRKPRQSSSQLNPSVERKVIRVKPERLRSPFPLPPIDLSKPTAPPSPTDDPILLIGPPVPVRSGEAANKTLVAVGDDAGGLELHHDQPTGQVHASSHHAADESTWHISLGVGEETALLDVGFDGLSQFDTTFDPASDSDSNDEAPLGSTAFHGYSPRLDLDKSTGSHVFHSDDDEAEGEVGEDEGEYTGRFKFYSVPVKQDPPSSATRARRDSWGRPISPFPFKKRASEPQVRDVDVDEEDARELFNDESPPPSPSDGRRRPGTPKRSDSDEKLHRSGGYTLSEMEARLEARNARKQEAASQEDHSVEKEETDSEMSETAGKAKSGRGDMIVGLDEGHSDEDLEADEDAESVEREVTPMDDTVNVGDAPAEDELSEGDGHGETASSDDALQSQHTPGNNVQVQDDNRSHDGNKDKEHDVRRSVSSPHQNSEFQTIIPLNSAQFTEHYDVLQDEEDDDPPGTIAVYDDGDDSSDEESVPTGVVEISSDDPKAAARAAAILKLHHSYIVDGVVPQRARRSSFAFSRRRTFACGDGDTHGESGHLDIIRRAGRKSLTQSGGVLQHHGRRTTSSLPRSTFVPPGSPAGSVASAEDALREAETEIRATSASPLAPRTPLRSPLLDIESPQSQLASPSVAARFFTDPESAHLTVNQREWTKSDWKTLDMCFTDERIAIARTMGLSGEMAEVHNVDIDAVVDRFLTFASEDWDRDMLLRRTTALSARQRAGKGAPPSPHRLGNERPATEPVRLATPPFVQKTFIPPPDIMAHTKIPPSLLAPRYAHLHEEAAMNIVEQSLPPSSVMREPDLGTSKRTGEPAGPAKPPAQPSRPQSIRHAAHVQSDDGARSTASASATKRVLSYIGSFLGRGVPATATKSALKPTFNALPLPPPEMLQIVRGPVNTPAKKPIPKIRAPRELVQLTETRLPPRPSVPPRAKCAREMVELNHIEPPRSVQRPRTVSVPIVIPGRSRKDSGGSVKDLVQSFEEVQKRSEEQMARLTGSRGVTAMRKAASVGDLKSRAPWKP